MEKVSQKVPETEVKGDKIIHVRVTEKTRELLTSVLKKVNSKERGRSIKADEVIALALNLITSVEIKQLQEASLSNADRLELSYQKYIRENSPISKDEWIGILLDGGQTEGGAK